MRTTLQVCQAERCSTFSEGDVQSTKKIAQSLKGQPNAEWGTCHSNFPIWGLFGHLLAEKNLFWVRLKAWMRTIHIFVNFFSTMKIMVWTGNIVLMGDNCLNGGHVHHSAWGFWLFTDWKNLFWARLKARYKAVFSPSFRATPLSSPLTLLNNEF